MVKSDMHSHAGAWERDKVPAIRFEGFGGEWRVETFKTLTKINQGLQIAISNRYIEKIDNSYFYITNEFLKEGADREYYILNPPESVLCTEDDVLMTRTGNTGEVVTNIAGAFHNNFFKIKFDANKVSKNFFVCFLKLFKTQRIILILAGSSTIPDLNHNDFYGMEMAFPTLKEQTKIGNYFQQLDTLITQHQKKHDKLLNLKKSLLEKMFPKQGANVPEIRFKGFSGAWEEKVLSEVTKITMGQSPNGENYTDNPDGYILVQGNADMKNGFVKPRIWTTQVTKTADAGDLIFSVRAPVGEVGKTAYNLVIGRGVAAIKANEFIFQCLSKMNSNGYWTKLSAGSTFDSINSTDLSTAVIQLASSDEQTKIGNLFKQLDTLINQHQAQLKKLNNIKQACLEKMFV